MMVPDRAALLDTSTPMAGNVDPGITPVVNTSPLADIAVDG